MDISIYPHSNLILTDKIFAEYGGHTDNTMLSQRQAAYLISEMAVSDDLSTFLTQTIVTGSYVDPGYEITLDHGFVNSIILVRFKQFDESIYYAVSGTANWHVALRHGERGILDLSHFYNCCACPAGTFPPYKVDVVYNAGLSSGTVYQPNFLLALTTYADIILNEIIGFGNEAPGDVGIKEFSNQQYSEVRQSLIHTAYGNSPRAQFAHRLLTRYRKQRYVGI